MRRHILVLITAIAVSWPAMSVRAGQANISGCITSVELMNNMNGEIFTRLKVSPIDGGNQFYISVTKKYLKHGNHYFGNFLSPEEIAQHQYLLKMLNTSASLRKVVKFSWYTTGASKDFIRSTSFMPLSDACSS